MAPTITTFLMFEGRAEEAMNHYVSLFDDSGIVGITRYGPEGPGAEGSVMYATFTLAGSRFMAIDSAVEHEFTFTPSMSLFVECESEDQIRGLHGALAQGGEELMALGDYGFSTLFAWINDRFGVSWQLTYEGDSDTDPDAAGDA
ncbi:MAG: VOC family protein [Longimicrobiales bacterium]